GEVLGERRLARSGIAEEAKDRGAAARRFEPIRGRGKRGILVGRENRHRRPGRRSAAIKNRTGTFVKAWIPPRSGAIAALTRTGIARSRLRQAPRPGSPTGS